MDHFKNEKFTLSTFQFFNVGLFSFYVAFLPLYLNHIGLSAQQIAVQNFLATLIMMFSQPLVLEITGGKFTPSRIIKVLSILSLVTYLLFLSTVDFLSVSIFWSIFIASRVSSLTLIDVDILGKIKGNASIKFEHIRLWGSVGFIVIGFILGILFKSYDAVFGTRAVILLVLIQTILSFNISGILANPVAQHVKPKEVINALKSKKVFLLFTVVGLIWVSHAPLYTFFSLYLERLGFSPSFISLCWNLGVVGEIVLFMLFSRLEKLFSLKAILQFSIIATVLRWLLLANCQSGAVIICSQLLHAFSFGGVYLCGVKLSYSFFPEGIKHKSQGYLSLLGIGLGSLLGRIGLSALTGSLQDYSDVTVYFILAMMVSIIAFVVSLFMEDSEL